MKKKKKKKKQKEKGSNCNLEQTEVSFPLGKVLMGDATWKHKKIENGVASCKSYSRHTQA